MARARNIKPGFFKNEVLAEMPAEVRLLFIGLWTLADREGRLEDRPKRIKAELFAFDTFDVDSMLQRLQDDEFLDRYEVDGKKFIQITNFVKHQDPHYREKASEIPAPPGKENEIIATGVTRTQRARILERDQYTCQECGSQEHLCIDHVLPVSRGGDSSDENLQVLCLSCNTKKGNKLSGESMNMTRPRAAVLPGYGGRTEVDATSNRASPNEVDANHLIPDSLIPDSLNLIPDSLPPAPHSVARAVPGGFEKFWAAYPKKASKGDAEKAFKKLHPDLALLEQILQAIEKQKGGEAWMKDGGQFIPHPATWLNGKRWEDEVVPYAPQAKQSSGAWWATDATIIAKGAELGMRPLPGEQMLQFKGRIQAAIDNGGKPPTPKQMPAVVVRETVEQIDADKGDKKKPGIPVEARQAMLSAAGSRIKIGEAA